MQALGGYQPLSGVARAVGDIVFVGVLGLAAVLEHLQFQLRATESARWWASNGRDVVNTFALATMAVGMRVIGFTGPMSFLLAATLVVTLTALQASFERSHHGIVVSAGTSLFLGLPILLAPAAVDAHVKSLLETLFP